MKPPYIMLSRTWFDLDPHVQAAFEEPNPDAFLICLLNHPSCTTGDRDVIQSLGWGRICIEENEYGMVTISRAED